VDGVFDRKVHTNRKEAEFIVDLIYQNIEKYPNRSLGVVAFSVAQQDLIDKLLSKRRQSTPEKEYFFKNDGKEPFFIKNLETVQGDERDTIIFSIAYGVCWLLKLPHRIAAPAGMIGASNFFELAVAVAVALFGTTSPAALATTVGVLTEVPVMLFLVKIANKTKGRFPA